MTMAHDDGAAQAAATYFESWRARDFARLRTVLADDVDFDGPFGQVSGGDGCLRGLEGLSRIMTGIEIQKVFTDGSDVLTWYVMATSVAAPVAVANWMRVSDGKITRIRVAFDARGLAGGS
jgi:ketosteroid isomerase-like protein